jgi:dienelactone hydrolase
MRRVITVLLGLAASITAQAQPITDEAPPAEIAAKVAAMTAAAEAGGRGAFPADMVVDASLPTHTLYRPRDLAAATRRGKLPIIAWGNGACANYGNRFRYMLTDIASHGYLILAIGPRGPQVVEWKVSLDPANPLPTSERLPGSYAAQQIDAIDWALAENARKGSPYYNRLDTKAIAVMGQSCGGLQTISSAADRRVKTAVVLNSGTFPEGRRPLLGTGDAIKASLRRIRVPTAWISGDESDSAYVNSNDDYAAFANAPALRAWHKGTGHSSHYREVHGGLFGPVVVQWLDWQLKRRKAAASTFTGHDCSLCKAAGWTVQTKGF